MVVNGRYKSYRVKNIICDHFETILDPLEPFQTKKLNFKISKKLSQMVI